MHWQSGILGPDVKEGEGKLKRVQVTGEGCLRWVFSEEDCMAYLSWEGSIGDK
jgi:hypothetical protein